MTAAIIRELLGEFRIPLRFNQQTLPVALRGSIVLMPQDGDSLNRVMDRAQATIEDLQAKVAHRVCLLLAKTGTPARRQAET